MISRRTMVFAGLGLGAASAAGYYVDAKFRESLRFHQNRISSGSSLYQSVFGTIEYTIVGSGPPILALHGSGGGFDQAADNIGPMAQAGFSIVCPSRFGYLRSDNPAGASPEMQADAMAALLKQLKTGPSAVLGFSAGAVPALHFAARHPDLCKALGLLVPAVTLGDVRPAPEGGLIAKSLVEYAVQSDFLFWLGCQYSPTQIYGSVLATNPDLISSASPEEQARAAAMMWNILPISPRSAGLLNDVRFTSTPLSIDVSKLNVPTLLISFEDDLYGTAKSARTIAGQIHDARLKIYPTGGHIFIGHASDVFTQATEFVREHLN